MNEHLTTRVDAGVLEIGIERPAKKNAFTRGMYLAAAEALLGANDDPAVRVLLLRGNGGNFSTGNDVTDFGAPLADGEQHPSMTFLNALVSQRKPVVAAVEGWAVGIGATLLLHCDLVYAGRGARLMFPFVNLGLTPEAGSSLLLPLLMGRQRAAELLLLGEALPAAIARDYGLVNEVLDDEAVVARARERAGALAAKAPEALRQTCELMRAARSGLATHMLHEEQVFKQRLRSPEAAEAFAAFADKRVADFSRFD